MSDEILMASADLDDTDLQAVVEVMKSGRLALGPKTLAFEKAMAEYIGTRHAIAVSSGTAGLHLIVRALGLGPGDEVIVPSYTFVASVNALLFEGVTPVFVDIEAETYNLDPEDVRRRLSPRTKAIMVVDVFGHPADWDALERIAKEHDLALIDDCCEALGAEYRGRRLGTLGVAGAFAFYPNKQMTTGEGGIVVTDDDAIADACRSMRNQGRATMGSWLQHQRLGYNYRMNELSAALGVTQLARLDRFLTCRENVAAEYGRQLAGIEAIRTPRVLADIRMSWFVYVITLRAPLCRDEFMKALEKRGIPSRAYFEPVHNQPYLTGTVDVADADLPRTMEAAKRTVALPFHNRMTPAEVKRVAEACAAVCAEIH